MTVAYKVGAMVPVSVELCVDQRVLDDALAHMFEEAFDAMQRRAENVAIVEAWGLTPLDHRPGRVEWREATRPDRVRRNIRANLGMRPGQTAHMVRSAVR